MVKLEVIYPKSVVLEGIIVLAKYLKGILQDAPTRARQGYLALNKLND